MSEVFVYLGSVFGANWLQGLMFFWDLDTFLRARRDVEAHRALRKSFKNGDRSLCTFRLFLEPNCCKDPCPFENRIIRFACTSRLWTSRSIQRRRSKWWAKFVYVTSFYGQLMQELVLLLRIGLSGCIPRFFNEAHGAFRNVVPNDEWCLCVFDRFFRPIGARVVVFLIKKERWIVISVSQAVSIIQRIISHLPRFFFWHFFWLDSSSGGELYSEILCRADLSTSFVRYPKISSFYCCLFARFSFCGSEAKGFWQHLIPMPRSRLSCRLLVRHFAIQEVSERHSRDSFVVYDFYFRLDWESFHVRCDI